MDQPDVYLFNPTCEMAVGNNTISYQPPLHLQKFEEQLSSLPHIIAQEKDFVISTPFSSKHLDHLNTSGFKTPAFVTTNQIESIELDALKPWGWSRVAHRKLELLKPFCSPAFKSSPNYKWVEDHKLFFSRQSSYKLCRSIFENNSSFNLLDIPHPPVIITSMDELKNLRFIEKGWVAKSPWSSSGRGIVFVKNTLPSQAEQKLLQTILKQHKFFVIEPCLNKLAETSLQFHIHPNGDIDYLGHAFFVTNDAGKFSGSIIDLYPNSVTSLIPINQIKDAIDEAVENLLKALLKLKIHLYYNGPVGIDAMFHQTQNEIFLHPAIEINIRHSMGYLTLALRKKVHPLATGFWEIDFHQKQHRLSTISQTPLEMEDGFIKKGEIALTPPENEFIARMIIN